MSRPSISRTSSLSSASSFVSVTDTNADTDGGAQTTNTKSSDLKRTRKRFSHDQLIVLEQAYHSSSHPTRDERQEIAKEAGMDVKSVTIWFQNKRQTERKVALGNSTNRNAPLPLAMYPVHYSTQHSSTDSSSRPNPTTSHTSVIPSKLKSYLPTRTASGPLSLDRVASRSERAPRTPTKLTRRSSLRESRPHSPDALWEAMLSSPIQPESNNSSCAGPLSSPSAREYLDFASTRYGKHGSRPRGRRTLEWACAAARLTVDKDDASLTKSSDLDVPIPRLAPASFDMESTTALIDDDASTEIVDTEVESVGDSHEAVTPDTSQIMYTQNSSPTRAPRIVLEEAKPEEVKTMEMALDMKSLHIEKDTDIMDAAWTLCGLSTLRG